MSQEDELKMLIAEQRRESKQEHREQKKMRDKHRNQRRQEKEDAQFGEWSLGYPV